jgi:hypothetical protein
MALALGLATPASAAPAAKLIMVELENYELSFANPLPAATAEPGGLLVPPDVAKEWLDLGLLPGDVIRFKNGRAARDDFYVGDGVTVIDLIRNGKPVILHIVAHGRSTSKAELTADQWKELDDTIAKAPIATPVEHDGEPSGVRIVDLLMSLYTRVEVGDIVRTVAGVPIHSNAELVAALHNLSIGTTTILVDRDDRPVTITLTRNAPIDLSQIQTTGRDHVEMPRELANALVKEPQLMAQGAQIVPAERDGKVHGQRMLAIDPRSVAARVGVADGDIVLDIGGKSIDSIAEVYAAEFALSSADSITIHVLRKGRPHELVVAITD